MEAAKESADGQRPHSNLFLFKLNLADALRLTMLGTLLIVVEKITRLPIHLPGHASIWLGIMVLGKGLIPRFGAGIIMGLVAGMLAVLLGQGREGVFILGKFLLPGLLLDFLVLLLNSRLESPVTGAIYGALAGLVKMAVSFTVGMLLKLPMGFLALGLGFAFLSHAVFGAAGGAVASLLIRRMKPRSTNWA